VDIIRPRHATLKRKVAASITESGGIVTDDASGLESIVALVCGGAIGSLLVYGYQKWIKKR
jgi:hypothetical protein